MAEEAGGDESAAWGFLMKDAGDAAHDDSAGDETRLTRGCTARRQFLPCRESPGRESPGRESPGRESPESMHSQRADRTYKRQRLLSEKAEDRPIFPGNEDDTQQNGGVE